MKKLLTATALAAMVATSAQAVEKVNQDNISAIFTNAGLENTWAGTSNVWVKSPGPGYDKATLEGFGYQMCAGTAGKNVGGYRITFWHQLGHGEITRVWCSN
jgi:hypothetical protein